MRVLVLFLSLIIGACHGQAQGSWPPRGADELFVAKRWHTADGLPQNSVNAIAQTPDGYLWVGTFNGLARFDGVRFSSFTIGNTPDLPADNIDALHVTPDGALWIAMNGAGVARFHEGRFTRMGPANGLDDLNLLYFQNDALGNLWLGSMRTLFRQEGSRFLMITNAMPLLYPLRGFAIDQDNQLWTSSRVGVRHLVNGLLEPAGPTTAETSRLVIDRQGRRWHFELGRGLIRSQGDSAELMAPMSKAAEVMVAGPDGRTWLGGGGHPLTFFDAEGAWEFRTTEVLARKDITALWPDHVNGIWVGLDGGGLVQLRPRLVKTPAYTRVEPFDNTVSITQDRTGKIWTGRLGSRAGLSSVSAEDGSFATERGSFDGSWVSSCLAAKDGRLWVGTYGHGLHYLENGIWRPNPRGPLPHVRSMGTVVRALFEDRGGGFWVGTDTGGAIVFRNGERVHHWQTTGLSHDKVTAITDDASTNVWIGTANGLNRVSPVGDTRRFHQVDGLGANVILSLFTDRRGDLWIGTGGGGLTRYDGQHFATLTSAQGLVNDVVGQILEDDAGDLWIGTNRGLARMPRAELEAFFAGRSRHVQSSVFGLNEGLDNEECGGSFHPACLKDGQGRLWFCTVGGLVMIDPGKARAPDQAPRVHMEEVTADGRTLTRVGSAADSAVTVLAPPGVRALEIHFTAIEFGAAEKIRFRHKLEPYEQDWTEAGTRRVAYYAKLPPDRYQFRVRAVSNQGQWSESEATLALIVPPAWWQTAWFRGASLLGIASLAVAGYRRRIRQYERDQARHEEFSRRLIESQEAERQRVSRELHDGLGQTLLVIKNRAYVALEEVGNPPALERQLQEIWSASGAAVQEVRQISHALRPSRLDRLGLTRTIQSLGEQLDEVGGVETKLALENIDACLSPSDQTNFLRIVQESVNNIIKHSKASRVEISTRVEADTVVLVIADDGCGFEVENALDRQPGGGLGLVAITERVGLLHGHLQIDSEIARGTRLTISVPRQKAVVT